MEPSRRKAELPPIPAKRYFTIGEVSELCGVKPHVLRYWEQEFTQLKPVKRRGNRRYYQHHEVLLIRRIRELLYEEGFTISGARNRLDNARLDCAPDNSGSSMRTSPTRAAELRVPPRAGVDVAAIKRELRASRPAAGVKSRSSRGVAQPGSVPHGVQVVASSNLAAPTNFSRGELAEGRPRGGGISSSRA